MKPDTPLRRFYLDAALGEGARLVPPKALLHRLRAVLRMKAGAALVLFNARDGAWVAQLEEGHLCVGARLSAPQPAPELTLVFAPVKGARMVSLVEKAVEMGVGRLQPVRTRRTIVSRVNPTRMQAHIIEAAEQCGNLAPPTCLPLLPLDAALRSLPPHVMFCDEGALPDNPLAALRAARKKTPAPWAIIIGPEGGFDDAERDKIGRVAGALRVSLGPRVLRADTAVVAALALFHAAS